MWGGWRMAADMRPQKILIVGNSHTRMIARALDARRRNGVADEFDIEICWLTTPGKSAFGDTSREDALAKVRALGPTDLLVVTWLGTAHNILGLLEHEIPFSLGVTVDGPVAVPPGVEIIPFNLMREMLDNWIRGDEVVRCYSEVAMSSIVHLMAPPPKERIVIPDRKPGGQPPEAPAPRFASAPGRLALWKLESVLVRRYVMELGVQYLEAPEGTRDASGFLLPEFQAADATHANAAYGECCLKAFCDMVRSTRSRPGGA